jgi:GTPase
MEGVTKEDFRIINILQDNMRPFALVVNKWDLCRKEGVKTRDYETAIRRSLRFIYNAPVVFISALTGENVPRALDIVCELAKKSGINFSTDRLNEILKQINIKSTRLYSIRQTDNSIPEFEIIAKKPSSIMESEKRHVMNILRKDLGLEGIPVKLNFRKKRFQKERGNG